ncbi:transcriptional regulator [Bacillus cereus]|nr:transcriptional regulator [Bacillus cereus]PFK27158.1 transcriptional regulator [Bacillus cereus]PFP60728.1 transcriptional regulator [Bacillus cereus]PFV18702.1 transcriptional regulator [Bacillus cereus]PGK85899.1 transcriptional regulator [Bacillus cereus]
MTSDNLRYIRKTIGYTMKEFAQLVGVSMVTVYRWESGINEPPKSKQKRIQSQFNLTQEDIEEINHLLSEHRHSKLCAKIRAQLCQREVSDS